MNEGAGLVNLKEVGFTILETMIVLAVTGALFISIAATLNGRQSEAEFVHAIQDAQVQIQQVISQVSDGFYPNNNNFICTSPPGGGTINIAPGNATQGKNFGCVFLGKVIQFGLPKTSPNQNEQYQVYTVAGAQFSGSAGSGVGTTSPFENDDPTVVGAFTASDTGINNYSLSGALEYDLSTLWIKVTNSVTGTTTQYGSVGFLMEPGGLNSSGTGYNSGTQTVDLIPIDGTSIVPPEDQLTAVGKIDTSLQDSHLTADAPINPPGGVQICMVSGGTDQSGLINIGSSSGTLLASLSIKSNKTCS